MEITPEAPSELFQDWQRTQPQSSATAARPETANGCPVLRKREPLPRGARASCGTWHYPERASPKRARRSVPPLTRDLHGRRQTLPWDYFRVARHPRRTPEIPAQQLFFLEKRARATFSFR